MIEIERGRVIEVFDGDWNARSDGNRMWDLVDCALDDIPQPGTQVVLVAEPGAHRQMGESMIATVHDIRRPSHNPAAGWVVTFDWLPEHTCH